MGRISELDDPAVTALAQVRGFSLEEREVIITLVKEQTLRTHAVDQGCAMILAQIGARDFEWPEFDRWHLVFTRDGHFPPLWDGVERRPTAEAPWATWEAYQRRKLYLLIDWLHGLVVVRAEVRSALARYADLGLSGEITRQSAETICSACDRLNKESSQHHPEDVPPFHPGCRCLILAAPPRRHGGGPRERKLDRARR